MTRRLSAAAFPMAFLTAALAVPTPAAAQGGGVAVELNTLRQAGDVCQAYFVVRNDGATPLQALELDAFMFDAGGVIVDRLALPFPAVEPGRMKVMVFDLELACADVARVFVNEVLRCEADGADCAATVALSTRSAVAFER